MIYLFPKIYLSHTHFRYEHTHSHTHITAHPHRWVFCVVEAERGLGSILTGECCVVVMAWAALMDTWRAGVMLSLETMSYNRHPSISKRPPVAMVTSRSRRRELQLVRTWETRTDWILIVKCVHVYCSEGLKNKHFLSISTLLLCYSHTFIIRS